MARRPPFATAARQGLASERRWLREDGFEILIEFKADKGVQT